MFNKIVTAVIASIAFVVFANASIAQAQTPCTPGAHDQSSCTTGEGGQYLYGAQISAGETPQPVYLLPETGGDLDYPAMGNNERGSFDYLEDDAAISLAGFIIVGGLALAIILGCRQVKRNGSR